MCFLCGDLLPCCTCTTADYDEAERAFVPEDVDDLAGGFDDQHDAELWASQFDE